MIHRKDVHKTNGWVL